MNVLLQRAALSLLVLSIACGAREETSPAPNEGAPPSAAPGPPPASPETELPSRPETREDTIMLEGRPEVETSRLVVAPAGFTVPFSTYVPTRLESDIAAPSTARFTAAFAGQVNPEAYMEVFVYPAGSVGPTPARIVNDLVTTKQAAEHETFSAERPSWARATTGFRYSAAGGANITGSVSVAQHGDHHFHVIRHYPAEYGDGLPPRLHTILSHWRWDDTGRMLMH